MNPETESWNELTRQAADRLPGDFSARVLARVGSVRAARRQLAAMSLTLALCFLCTSVTVGWRVRQQQETSLTQWRSLASVTQAIDRGL